MIALLAMLPCVLILLASRRLEPAGRWMLRAAAAVAVVAISGVEINCDRPLRIVAMVDVSPSTRGGTFRDPAMVNKRLTQLAPDQSVDIRYFADGLTETSMELAVGRTRLVCPDADAIVLFSDGRFAIDGTPPPIFPVIDAALEQQGDARIEDVRLDEKNVSVQTGGTLAERSMKVSGANPSAVAAGELSGLTHGARTSNTVRAELNPVDRWPENDRMSAIVDTPRSAEPWFITDGSQLPESLSEYLAPPAIVLPNNVQMSAVQEQNLAAYVRVLGGTLILVGSPGDYAASLRGIAPLTATPPKPQSKWVFLLDASGSMGTESRWAKSIDVIAAAMDRLDPQEDVSVAVFNREVRPIIDHVSPTAVVQRLESLRKLSPTGPTGLAAAIASVVSQQLTSPVRLVLVTDGDANMGDIESLAGYARTKNITTHWLNTGVTPANPDLLRFCAATGGSVLSEANPQAWPTMMTKLIVAARGPAAISITNPFAGEAALAGTVIGASRAYPSFLREGATIAARLNNDPIIASWNVGVGTVVSVAADIDTKITGKIASAFGAPPSDPRLTVTFDEHAQKVRVRARDSADSMTSLSLSLTRVPADTSPARFTQIAPGEYFAELSRSQAPSIAVVDSSGRVIARRAIATRYPAEFDIIGNDLPALEKLAAQTGGRIIASSDMQPITFPRQYEWQSFRPFLSATFALLLAAAMVMIRDPFLIQRLRRFFKRFAA